MRWVGYLRVSTQEQATSGLGLEAQEASIRQALGHPDDALVCMVRDEGESGKDMDRPGMREALGILARGEADGLVVAKLDRLSRSLIDFAAFVEWAERAGVSLRVIDLGIDTSTPTGRLVGQIMAACAEWERGQIAQRTRDALTAKLARGERVSGPMVATDRPELAERIGALRAEGMTLRAIADVLNAEGVPTSRGGAMWRASSVLSATGYRQPPRRRKPAELPAVTRRRRATA